MTDLTPIRVILVDDHDMVRRGLAVFLQAFDDLELVGEASNGTDALRLCDRCHPDVVLMDLTMPDVSGAEATRRIKEVAPEVNVLALTIHEEEAYFFEMLNAGASGYIPKSCSRQVIHQAVHAILDGNRWVPEAYRNALTPVTSEEKDLAAKIATLTPQQYRVLCYLREGWLNKQIGFELGVTEATIKAHITAIFRKLGTTNRTQAVIMLSKMSLHDDKVN